MHPIAQSVLHTALQRQQDRIRAHSAVLLAERADPIVESPPNASAAADNSSPSSITPIANSSPAVAPNTTLDPPLNSSFVGNATNTTESNATSANFPFVSNVTTASLNPYEPRDGVDGICLTAGTYWSAAASECADCQVGTASNCAGVSACVACAAGTYADLEGQV
jgi:hypothetical protein